ncbi:conserved hypothetical protein [Hyella patelloides LEGE 07179]|uniref:DUF302 domain-containing protein n=1 Tax=Hyella patelloides LEGE 07179 TaxID=945734 RepID=A0A563W4K3_9CYAN|nr:DUF302 domain-containing protein [Hyella patelloides]VEP18629.1 conserved hypothetical protein [Hyella patelloides LEGE 07179]
MKKNLISLIFLGLLINSCGTKIAPKAQANVGNGFISVASFHDVTVTADRFEELLKAKELTIFARINHSEGASKVGENLRPTELIIFGNPRVGTPLMQCSQSVAIDLPQKALFWEDENGKSWLSYNDPNYLANRHQIEGCENAIQKITGVLDNLADAATKE